MKKVTILVSSFFLLSYLTAYGADVTKKTVRTKDTLALKQYILNMQKAYSKVKDYTAILYKQEWIDGEMRPVETIFMKFREKPFSVYMKWIKNPHKNQEVIFVKGWNRDRLKVHKGSFPDITMNINPLGRLAMRGNRHTILEAGIGNIVKTSIDDLMWSEKHPEAGFKLSDCGEVNLYGTMTHCIEILRPVKRKPTDYAHRIKMYIDNATGLPVGVQIWDYKGIFVENYAFSKVKLNVGLTDKDFSPDNPNYDF